VPPDEPSLREALQRGWRKKCPRCGQGPLFRGWFSIHSTCSVCDLSFEGNQGDTWAFWVVGDRIILFGAIAALYLGFTPESWALRTTFFVLIVAPLVATMPHRRGAFLALDYLSRTRWR